MADEEVKKEKEDKQEEKQGEVKEPKEESKAEAPETEGEGEEESRLQTELPMAPIVRMIRGELDNDKIIRRRVKEEMVLWLEKVCRKVSCKMNESEYTVVELDDFRTAIEPYELIDDVEGERHRIVATLEKVKQDCDSLIRDVSRKFITHEMVSEETEEEEAP